MFLICCLLPPAVLKGLNKPTAAITETGHTHVDIRMGSEHPNISLFFNVRRVKWPFRVISPSWISVKYSSKSQIFI